MKVIEYRIYDKTEWSDGPWKQEPDKRQWPDPTTGYPCLALRNWHSGSFCGYVGVPPDHPAYGLHYDGITKQEADESYQAFREEMRNWAKAGYPPLEKWWKEHPTTIPEREAFPGVGTLLGNIEVHGGLTFADKAKPLSQSEWRHFRTSIEDIREKSKSHPLSDAIQYLTLWEDTYNDYEAWIERHNAITIRHVTELGEPNDVWWFGFDCNHAFDLAPKVEMILRTLMPRHLRGNYRETYRDLNYVVGECTSLAKELMQIGKVGVKLLTKEHKAC